MSQTPAVPSSLPTGLPSGASPGGVLVIGGRTDVLRKAKALGLHVVYVQQPEYFLAEEAAWCDKALLVDYTDWRELRPLVAAAHEAYGFTCAFSTLEPALEPVGLVNELLGFDGNPHQVSNLLRDKWAMRRHLAGAGPLSVAAAEAGGRESLVEFGRAHGFPFILKPVDAAASLGVLRVDGPGDIDAVLDRLEGLRGSSEHQFANFFRLERFLLEEYLDGPEYSVESLSFDGRHTVVAITEKRTHTEFVELGHALPARLAPGVEAEITGCVTAFLDAVGLRQGPAHTEVRLSSRGPKVIESHDRTGGDRISELVEAAYGIDLEARALAWLSGRGEDLPGRPRPLAAAATRFLTSAPGTVVEIHGVEAARALDGVLDVSVGVRVGDTVPPLQASWDRVGQILVTAADTAAAVDLCDRVAEKISIVTA
ncbi:ATP-grasp domain-containing protein [Streptomyces sp. NPDC053542]|uniref:ATP-grasp domain-containing protein n=1 Tax=Streptomyces sp. NPDC053542 TaxID=3365710 RepID=UPI0037D1C8A8